MIDVLCRGSRATGRARARSCSADFSRTTSAVPLRSAGSGLPGATVLRRAEGAAATLAPVPQHRVDFLERAFVRGRNAVAGRSWLKSPQGPQCHNRACTERSLSDAAPKPRNADRRHRGERRPGDPDGESRDPSRPRHQDAAHCTLEAPGLGLLPAQVRRQAPQDHGARHLYRAVFSGRSNRACGGTPAMPDVPARGVRCIQVGVAGGKLRWARPLCSHQDGRPPAPPRAGDPSTPPGSLRRTLGESAFRSDDSASLPALARLRRQPAAME